MIKKEHTILNYSELEYKMYDLRHQIITQSIYQKGNLKYADDFSKASPISIVREQKESGERIDLYLDNIWGIKQGRILHSSPITIPYMVKSSWVEIRHPDFEIIRQTYFDDLNSLENDRQMAKIRRYNFDQRFNELHCDYFYNKQSFVQEHDQEIQEGLYYDLCFRLE